MGFYCPMLVLFQCIFFLFCSMNKQNRYSVQDALQIITGDDSDFDGCESSSDEDPEDPDYTPSNKEMENDESSGSSDSDTSESNDLDEVPQPDLDPGQQNTSAQQKRLFSWRK